MVSLRLLRTSLLTLGVVKLSVTNSFSLLPSLSNCHFSPAFLPPSSAKIPPSSTRPTTALLDKKKKASPASAALEALEALEALGDQPLSLKEQKELAKKQRKEAKTTDDPPVPPSRSAKEGQPKKESPAMVLENKVVMKEAEPVAAAPPVKKLSKKDEMLAKALAMEAMDEAAADPPPYKEEQPKLSKKELKELQKKEEKQRLKDEKKRQTKEQKAQDDGDVAPVNGDAAHINGDAAVKRNIMQPVAEESAEHATPTDPEEITLEEKIRKERPPPRIRVMESTQPGYVSLRLENVGVTFRNQEVLKDVTWGVQSGDRIGLVGANGAGKTTQLRILAGELEPTVGDVVKSSNSLRVAILRQEFVDELVLTRTLREEMLSVFEEENKILQEMKAVEEELAQMGDSTDTDKMQAILDRMQELQNEAENKEVYVLESRVQKVMDLMGFTEDEADGLVASFSGGWKMRIGLGKVLLRDPNILLLDEPTNHLDLDSVEWLEAFLREQSIPMIVVSHDREFLDQVCTKIVDAEGGACTEYDGNYSRFLQLKQARMDAWQAAYDAQEKKIKEERQWINQFRTKQPVAVKQREAKLEKLMKSEEYIKKPPFLGKPFRFRFPDAPRLSPEVAEVKRLSHSYRSKTTENKLFEDVDLFIQKGDRIAVVGPNGAGKSTLLRLITGKEKPDKGEAALVGQNVLMNYFEQNQADVLDLDKTVLETIQGASSGQSYNELRALLGQFLFKGDSVDKKVEYLSGGEKARLSLCCMMLRPANLLILDEPTNHLDISSCEMLEEALQHFAGSVVVVSHDRYFVSKVANSIVAIENKKLIKYQGDYKLYMEKSEVVREKVEARYVTGIERIESAPIIDLELIDGSSEKKKKNFGGSTNAHMVTRKDKGVKNSKRLQQRS